MDLIKGLMKLTDRKKNRSLIEYIQDRILDVSFNLSKISETGNYISNDTATLTLCISLTPAQLVNNNATNPINNIFIL